MKISNCDGISTGTVLRTLVRRNCDRKLLVSIQCHNLNSFKDEVILLSQSILEIGRIAHLFSSVLFTIFTILLQTMNDSSRLHYNLYSSKSKLFRYKKFFFFSKSTANYLMKDLKHISSKVSKGLKTFCQKIFQGLQLRQPDF